MTDYGIQPTGFVRKSLPTILAEIQSKNMTQFGADVLQTPQEPLGQWNGLAADLATFFWELAEDLYQSYDPDQAEGARLDTLAKIRLLNRSIGENDGPFRQAITNAGRARNDIQDLARAVFGLDGVTYAQAFVNDSGAIDDDSLLPSGSVAVAVIGGDDAEIGAAIRRFVVPGISTFGNEVITTNIDGFCRSLSIIRPILIPVTLIIEIHRGVDQLGCPAPSPTAIATGAADDFKKLINGEDVTLYRCRQAIEGNFDNVEVVSMVGERDGEISELNVPIKIGFIELATIAVDGITLVEV